MLGGRDLADVALHYLALLITSFGLVFLSPNPINQPTGTPRSLQKVTAQQDVALRSEGSVKPQPLELVLPWQGAVSVLRANPFCFLLSVAPSARTIMSYSFQRMRKRIQTEEVDRGLPHPGSQLRRQDLFLSAQREGVSCWFLLSSTGRANVLQTEVGCSRLSITLTAVASAVSSNSHFQGLLRAQREDC